MEVAATLNTSVISMTQERVLFCVGFDMVSQTTFTNETFSTGTTRERFFSCVTSHVAIQIAFLAETLSAC